MKCNGDDCQLEETARNNEVIERYSFGIYAGRYCNPCWKKSGYRDEPASAFDPMDAGETLEPEDY